MQATILATVLTLSKTGAGKFDPLRGSCQLTGNRNLLVGLGVL